MSRAGRIVTACKDGRESDEMKDWGCCVVAGIKPDIIFSDRQHIFIGLKGCGGRGLAGEGKNSLMTLPDFHKDVIDHMILFDTGFLVKGPLEELENILLGGFDILYPFFVLLDETDDFVEAVPGIRFVFPCQGLLGLFFQFRTPFGLVVGNARTLVDLLGPEKQGADHGFFNKNVFALGAFLGRHVFKVEQSVLALHLVLGDDIFVFCLMAFVTNHENLVEGVGNFSRVAGLKRPTCQVLVNGHEMNIVKPRGGAQEQRARQARISWW
jgi:hypothetical protein